MPLGWPSFPVFAQVVLTGQGLPTPPPHPILIIQASLKPHLLQEAFLDLLL